MPLIDPDSLFDYITSTGILTRPSTSSATSRVRGDLELSANCEASYSLCIYEVNTTLQMVQSDLHITGARSDLRSKQSANKFIISENHKNSGL